VKFGVKEMLHGLDLFSGIGGNTLALRDYIKTVAYCEADRHAQSVLLSRMGDGSIEPAPIWDDVKTLGKAQFDFSIDIIVGGFPCQDISVAGNGSGLGGERSGLVFEIFRLVNETKPAFVFLENVSAIRTRGGERVVKELAALGYDCRWDVLSAFDVGAPHRRERWFLLAYAKGNRWEKEPAVDVGHPERSSAEGCATGLDIRSPDVADADKERRERRAWPQSVKDGGGQSTDGNWWSVEPALGRMANGVPLRMDRLKRLGNAVVPLQAKTAFERLMGIR
jgi:DNA (cytosine-5)-methyltransferase 1